MEKTQSERKRGIILALISAITFSTLGLFAKLAYKEGMGVFQTLAWRFSLSSIILWIILISKRGYKHSFRDYRDAFLFGILGFCPQAGLYFVTLKFLDPGLASLLLYLYPAIVVLLSFLFLKKSPTKFQIAALLCSSAGCVLTFWTKGNYPLVGYILGVVVALCYAIYLTSGEKIMARFDSLFITTCILSSAAIVFWIITLLTKQVMLPRSFVAIAGVFGIAIFGSVLPILSLMAAIKLLGSSDSALISTVEPVCTVLLSVILLGEQFLPLQIVGGVLILSAVILCTLSGKAKNK